MASITQKDVVDSIARLWNTSMFLLVIWVVSLPGAIENLRAYDTATHFTAWRLLVGLTRTLPTDDGDSYLKVGWVRNNPQSGFVGEGPPRYQHPLMGMVCRPFPLEDSTVGEACDPLVVEAHWPAERQSVVFLSAELLRPIDNFDGTKYRPDATSKLAHFLIVTHRGPLPFQSYLITRVHSTKDIFVVHSKRDEWTRTALAEWPDHVLMPYSRPLHWRSALAYLGAASLDEVTDDQLRRFQETADLSRGAINIGGVNLGVAYAYAGVGFLLAALAVLMLGPLSQLKLERDPGSQVSTWLPAVDTKQRPLLEAVASGLTWLWAGAPLIIAVLQLVTSPPLPMPYAFIRTFGLFALMFSAYVFVHCARALRRVRRPAHRDDDEPALAEG